MQRWYMLRQSRGNPQNEKENIQAFLQNNRLSEVVPRFSIEKNAGLNGKPKGEFYILLTIDSDFEGAVPGELDNFLHSRYAGRPVLSYEKKRFKDFEGFLGKEVETRNIAYYIKYRPKPEEDDPHDLFQEKPIPIVVRSEKEVIARTEKMDKLLYWVSAMGNGTWEAFKKICGALGLDEHPLEARRILRRFRLLGHLDLEAAGMRWTALPATLIEIGPDEFYLIGQRVSRWVSVIKLYKTHFGEVSFEAQFEGNGPRIIRFKGLRASELIEKFNSFGIFSGLQIKSQAAFRMAQNLPDLAGWLAGLEATEGIVPALYDFERFGASGFKPEPFNGQSGMYRLRHIKAGDERGQAYTYYYDAPTQRWLRADWYGLRFLSQQNLSTAPQLSQVIYWGEENELEIKEGWRWPEIYERALVLSSGKLPERRGGNLYYSTSKTIACSLAAKLGLECKEN